MYNLYVIYSLHKKMYFLLPTAPKYDTAYNKKPTVKVLVLHGK